MKTNSEKTIVAKNTSILAITDIAARIMGTLLTIAIARILGVANLGLLAFALSFTSLFDFIPRFGFRNLITRDIAKEPNMSGSYLGNIFIIKLIFSALALCLIITALNLMHCTQEKILIVCIAAFIMVTDSFIEFFYSFFRAFQKIKYESLIKIILTFLTVSTGLTILFLGYGLVPLLSVRLLVYFLSFTLVFNLIIKKFPKPNFNIQWNFYKKLIKSAAPFAILSVIGLNVQVGIVLLTFFKGDVATGCFSAAQRLCGVFSFIPMVVVATTLPSMSKLSQNNMHNSLVRTHEGIIKYLLVISLPIAVGISILADDFILIIYGEKYTQSIVVLRILVWRLIFSYLTRAYMITFSSINKESIFVKIQFLGALINFCANIVLIPLIGPLGVSIAVVFSQITTYLFSSLTLTKYFPHAKISNIPMRPILAVLPMTIFLFLFKNQNVLLLVPISALLYSFSLLLLGTFTKNELLILQGLFKRKPAKI